MMMMMMLVHLEKNQTPSKTIHREFNLSVGNYFYNIRREINDHRHFFLNSHKVD